MADSRYPQEVLSEDEDNGTMVDSLADLGDAVVGRKIVSVERPEVERWGHTYAGPTVITLDNGRKVTLVEEGDCCAYTEVQAFLLNPELVDHIILGVGTTDQYETWHIYADAGDVLKLTVGWSAGNAFYYGYGFNIQVEDVDG